MPLPSRSSDAMSTIDRSKVWTGDLNDLALANRPRPKVGFYDTTLRDGEQSTGVMFDPEQKLEIATLVDQIGAGRIEAGFPRVSEDDREAIKLITAAGLKAEIWGFARAMPDDVAAVTDLGLRHAVIEAPVSDRKLKALGVSRDEVLNRIKNAVEFGVKSGVHVAFFGVDSTRADLAFLEQVYKTAKDAGAAEFAIVDTLAIATPEAVTYLIKKAQSWLGEDAIIHFHGHNDFGLGTADAIAAVGAGARWIHGTLDGIGERAGNANLPEIAFALEALYQLDTGFPLRPGTQGVRASAPDCRLPAWSRGNHWLATRCSCAKPAPSRRSSTFRKPSNPTRHSCSIPRAASCLAKRAAWPRSRSSARSWD
jgi:hypothetical protein